MRELHERIVRATGAEPVAYVARGGGYSSADRFAVTLTDGRSIFVKSAAAEHLAAWLRREHEVYAALEGPFIPRLVGWDDDGVRPLLAIEDLTDADWTPHWDAARIDAVRAGLTELSTSVPPPNTGAVEDTFAGLFGRWEIVANDPAPFLSAGLRDESWLERSLPVILEAAATARVGGTGLCHLDVRSDNLCFRNDRAIFVDWNWTSLANPDLDVAAWLPSVRVEGGPPPWELLPDSAGLAAFISGVWAAVVGLPPPETAPTVRAVQRGQLAVGLDWLDRELGLG